MLTKDTKITEITITESGIVLYRESTTVLENGEPITQPQHHRHSLTPGQSLEGIPPQVVAVCELVWTPAVIAAYLDATQLAALDH